MKNLIIVALTSLLLFSVSAGLSLWLKQSKEEAAETKKDDKKKSADDHSKPTEKEPSKSTDKDHSKTVEKDHESPKAANDELALKKEKFEKMKQQFEIIQHDLRTQQETLTKLMNQVAAESKAIKAMADDAENRATILKAEKESAEKALLKANEKVDAAARKPSAAADAIDSTNLEKTVQILEKLEPVEAAKMLQTMADKGNLDAVVKVLGRMKEAKVAGILSAMNDKEFSSQLVSKILATRTSKVTELPK